MTLKEFMHENNLSYKIVMDNFARLGLPITRNGLYRYIYRTRTPQPKYMKALITMTSGKCTVWELAKPDV